MLVEGVAVVGVEPAPQVAIDLESPLIDLTPAPDIAAPEPTPAELRATARREALARVDGGHRDPRDFIASAAKRHQAAIQPY